MRYDCLPFTGPIEKDILKWWYLVFLTVLRRIFRQYFFPVTHFHYWNFNTSDILRSYSGSYGDSTFNFPKNGQSGFHSNSTILHSHQQHIKVPVVPQYHQYSLNSTLKNITTGILVWVKCNLIVVFISLMTTDVDHHYICLLAICIFIWRNV